MAGTVICFRTVCLLLLLPLLLDGQAVDSGSDNQDQSQDDSMNNDPNLINPQNKQGYGKDVPIQVVTKSKAKTKKDPAQKTIAEQTHQALLQFGVLVSFFLCW